MHLLIVHNDYGIYSGEEAAVDRMIDNAQRCGHTVSLLRRTSAGRRDSLWGKVRGFLSGIYSPSGRREMRRMLRSHRLDVVVIHNLYPFISPAVLPLCRRAGIPVVMTVHNYRLICPTGLFLRNGLPCEHCLQKGNEWGCVRYNCEHSRFRSLGYALRNRAARRHRYYRDNVTAYCCLTDFQKEKLIAAGYDRERMYIVPNYIDFSLIPAVSAPGDCIAYVGRLSPEKGYDMLVEVARRHRDIRFCFAGDFRDGKKPSVPENVELLGAVGAEQVERLYRQARFVVIPSRCYEGFPSVLIEAAAHARCCIAPDHGAFPDLLKSEADGSRYGLLFHANDADDLERQIVSLWNDPERCQEMGLKARANCEKRFSKTRVVAEWDGILRAVVEQQHHTQTLHNV